MGVARLAEDPHGLGNQRLGGHVVSLEDAGVVRIGAADLVDAQVKALLRHLRGHHERAAGAHPVKNGVLVGAIAIGGDAADAEGLEDDGVVVALEQAEDAGLQLGREL